MASAGTKPSSVMPYEKMQPMMAMKKNPASGLRLSVEAMNAPATRIGMRSGAMATAFQTMVERAAGGVMVTARRPVGA